MLRILGIPTWFLTLSSADLHMFQNKVESFFTEFVYSNEHHLGEVSDRVTKIEFHAHLLWVKDAPCIDVDSDEDVCRFIDQYVSGIVPPDSEENKEIRELLLNLETHAHSQYCRRNGGCRFGFPKAPSPETLISCDTEAIDIEKKTESKEILSRVSKVLESFGYEISLAELLQHANVSQEQYTQSLKIAQRGKTVVLKRKPSDVFTNGCNIEILILWKGNIDFQYVVNEYSTVMYICDEK